MESRIAGVLQPSFVYPFVQPIDLMELMIAKRHQQILQKRPTITAEIENDQNEAKVMADMMHQRGMNTHQTKDQLFQQIMQHKLNFLDAHDKNSKSKTQQPFRRKLRPQDVSDTKPVVQHQQAKNLEELPYHYTRFERNLNAYHLEYDAKEGHVREVHQQKQTKRLSTEH